jgi:ABC-2 type transport system permease protein
MMKSYQALIKRELLEHRAAFLYAPAILLIVLSFLIDTGVIFGDTNINPDLNLELLGVQLARFTFASVFGLWGAYLMTALFFYYSDSFSADGRNNALLFWKSMPQSDLKILSSKALAGITIFPALIFAYAMLTGLLTYVLGFLVSAKLPFIPMIGPFDLVTNWIQMGVAGVIFFLLSVLWYAPFLAWVAGLSTLFRRWSIPLSFLIPAVVVFFEYLTQLGRKNPSQPIADYLEYRFEDLIDGEGIFDRIVDERGLTPFGLINEMLASVNWNQMAIGLIVAAIIVYLASEYRRRRIEA